MVNNHRHSYGESIKNPPRALLLNSIQTTNYALNVRFRSIGPQTPLLPVYFFLDTRWSDFMGKNKLADVCERLYLLVVYHAGRHAGFNQVPASI